MLAVLDEFMTYNLSGDTQNLTKICHVGNVVPVSLQHPPIKVRLCCGASCVEMFYQVWREICTAMLQRFQIQ